MEENSDERQPPMEDDLQWKMTSNDQTKINKFFKQRQHPMEDDLKRLKVEYFSNH
jgi:hypothetical protein